MPINKLKTTSIEIDAITADLLATGSITVADISDGEITAAKLHTTLDFSTKTFTMHNNHITQTMVTQHQAQLAIGADQIDSGSPTFGGDVTVTGNLTVNGTTTTLNTETLTVDDNIIVLNNNEAGTPSQNAGIEVERGTSTNVSLRWNETTDNWQFTNDGTTYNNLGTSDIVNDTTPQLGGDLDVNGNNIQFGDSEKAMFGDSNDLQIYHESTYNNSIIVESGGGNLLLGGSHIQLRNSGLSTILANFSTSADLYYNGTKKFETTNTGIAVTGTVDATAFTGDGSALTGVGGDITIQDEGSALSTAATTLNFVGAGVTASGTGATKTITIAGSAGGATSAYAKFTYEISATVNSVSGADTNGNTLSYNAGNNVVEVFVNGVKQQEGSGKDYQATTGSSVVFTNNLYSGDLVDVVAYNMFDAGNFNFDGSGNLVFGDNKKAIFGAGNDLQIYWDGTHGRIANTAGGNLYLTAYQVNFGDDVFFAGASYDAFWDRSVNSFRFNDNAKAVFGTDSDLIIQHDGSRSIIQDNGTGNLRIQANNLELKNADNTHDYIFCANGGAVELYHNNVKKLETTNTGVTITGDINLGDNNKINFGAVEDLQIYHDGSDSYIKDTGSGNLLIQYSDLYFSKDAGSTHSVVFRSTGNVGIGTTGPGYKLQVDHGTTAQYASSIRNTADNLQLLLGTTTGGLLNIQGKTINSNAAYQIALQAEGGNVGIGTASPSYKLHSETSSGTDYAGYFRNTSGSGNSTSLVARGGANNTSANFQVQDYNGNGDFTVNGIGQAMIGTTTPFNSRRRLSVHGVSTESSGYQDIVEFLEPSITGGTVSVNFGVANSLNNLAKVDFTYVGAGSTSNRVNLGFHSNDNKLMVYANGTVELVNGQTLNSTGATIQTVTATPNTMASGNPVNVWTEINSNYRVQMTSKKGGRILGTYHIPMNPQGASNILMAIQPWYSTNGGTTKNIISQGITSGSRHNLAVSWFRSSNGYDGNDMQNHVVHFHLDGITASTTVLFGWYFRSEGGNTTYFCHSGVNSATWGWTAPMYLELREIMT